MARTPPGFFTSSSSDASFIVIVLSSAGRARRGDGNPPSAGRRGGRGAAEPVYSRGELMMNRGPAGAASIRMFTVPNSLRRAVSIGHSVPGHPPGSITRSTGTRGEPPGAGEYMATSESFLGRGAIPERFPPGRHRCRRRGPAGQRGVRAERIVSLSSNLNWRKVVAQVPVGREPIGLVHDKAGGRRVGPPMRGPTIGVGRRDYVPQDRQADPRPARTPPAPAPHP